jgi:hypothetical protein
VSIFWCDGESSFCIVEFGVEFRDLNKAWYTSPIQSLFPPVMSLTTTDRAQDFEAEVHTFALVREAMMVQQLWRHVYVRAGASYIWPISNWWAALPTEHTIRMLSLARWRCPVHPRAEREFLGDHGYGSMCGAADRINNTSSSCAVVCVCTSRLVSQSTTRFTLDRPTACHAKKVKRMRDTTLRLCNREERNKHRRTTRSRGLWGWGR